MSDFIPGEAYRLDVVGADESILVDSWSSQIKASVVARDGTLQVDVDSGKIYGPLVGDIQDINGDVIFDSIGRILVSDIKGDVLDSAGNVVVDSELGIVNANVSGNVLDPTGIPIVDAANKTVNADAVYGTFYGDLIGSVSTENTMFGTFSGDFNGGHYGEFFGTLTGDVTGTLTGDLLGNMTGVVVGSLIGEVMADANTSLMSPPNLQYNQYNWLGGIGHPAPISETDLAKGPIVVLGETRAESHVIAHLNHYDGRSVVHLDQIGNSPWPAHHFGKFRGEVYTNDDKAILTYNSDNGQIILKSYGILSLEADNGTGDLNFVGDTVTFNVRTAQTIRSFNGTWENKSALLPHEPVLAFTGEGYDGSGWRMGGGFGIYLADEPVNQQAYKTFFAIGLSDGVNHSSEDENRGLIYDSTGKLKVPFMQLGETTFSQRDSMTPLAGTMIFNTSSKKFQGYTGSEWVDLH